VNNYEIIMKSIISLVFVAFSNFICRYRIIKKKFKLEKSELTIIFQLFYLLILYIWWYVLWTIIRLLNKRMNLN